jgi:DNA repair ATPase RecN
MYVLVGISFISSPNSVRAQDDEIQQLLLNVQKLDQLKDLLQDMKEKYEILNQGYRQVKDLTEGNFRLHEVFLNRLVQVNPKVKSYHRVAEIIQLQIRMVQAISSSKQQFRMHDVLDESELDQILRVYGSFSSSSLKNLEELTLLLSDGELEMDDWERLQGIDRIYESMRKLASGLGKYHVSLQNLTEIRKMNAMDSKTLKNVLGQN